MTNLEPKQNSPDAKEINDFKISAKFNLPAEINPENLKIIEPKLKEELDLILTEDTVSYIGFSVSENNEIGTTFYAEFNSALNVWELYGFGNKKGFYLGSFESKKDARDYFHSTHYYTLPYRFHELKYFFD